MTPPSSGNPPPKGNKPRASQPATSERPRASQRSDRTSNAGAKPAPTQRKSSRPAAPAPTRPSRPQNQAATAAAENPLQRRPRASQPTGSAVTERASQPAGRRTSKPPESGNAGTKNSSKPPRLQLDQEPQLGGSRKEPRKPRTSKASANATSASPATKSKASKQKGGATKSSHTSDSKRSAAPVELSARIRLWLPRIVLGGVGAVLAVLLLVMMLFTHYGSGLPKVETLKEYAPPQVTRMVDRHGHVISESFQERRTVVPMERIPRVLVLSVLAAEDADFYRHRGLDYAGILRALLRDLTPGRQMQGASTITQQIVKNVLLSPERTLTRKIRELILSRRLEQELTKDEILGMYLNHIYFGHGRYGVQEASRFFFGKDVDELTLAEASLIAGIPQSPNRLSPITHPKAARQRQQYVLGQLLAKRQQYWDDLSEDEIRAAENTKVKLADNPGVEGGAPEVVSTAKALLADRVGEAKSRSGGYTVETTIDLQLQRNAREALLEGLKALDRRQGLVGPLKVPSKRVKLEKVDQLRSGRTYDARVTGADDETGEIFLDVGGHTVVTKLAHVSRFNPDDLPASRFAPVGAEARAMVDTIGQDDEPTTARLSLGPQGAVVAIDARNREVLALVGADEANYGFNRATQAVRQPGSTFKPLVYAVALDSERFTPATLVLDAPEVFDEWRPNNYEMWHYSGDVRLREGLAKSINLVAIRVIQEVTPDAVVDFAKRLGISTDLDPSLALALGASGVRPIELVNAYATFAAGGAYSAPKMVRNIQDAKGSTINVADETPAEQMIRPSVAFVLTSMLQSVVQDGTAQAAKKLNRPVAGKTGTSNRARDAWFVGYTPDLVVGVWIGYDDHRPLGKGETGGKSALPIWVDIMKAATADMPVSDFPAANDVERASIDPKTGMLAYDGQPDAIEEVFLVGTVPSEVAPSPDVVDSSTFLMEQL